MDNELDRSFAKTGSIKIETPRDSIESEIATIGTAYPTEIGKPVAMADVAESSGPAGTGAGGPVVAGTLFLAVADRTGASGPRGTEAGGPVVTGTRFRTDTDVAEASGPAGAGGPVVTGTRLCWGGGGGGYCWLYCWCQCGILDHYRYGVMSVAMTFSYVCARGMLEAPPGTRVSTTPTLHKNLGVFGCNNIGG